MTQRLDRFGRLLAVLAFASAAMAAQEVSAQAQVFACTETDIDTATGAGVASGDTASDDDTLDKSCGLGEVGDGPDHVIEFTSTWAGTYVFDTCGSADYDTTLSALTGCGLGDEIACNDDFCGLQSSISVLMGANQTILILVDGYEGETGNWELNVTAPPPPDLICSVDESPRVSQTVAATMISGPQSVESSDNTWFNIGEAIAFDSSDFEDRAPARVESVAVEVEWAKGAGCSTPQGPLENPGHQETRFRLVRNPGPGELVHLMVEGTENGSPDYSASATTPHSTYVVNTFSDNGSAPPYPVSGPGGFPTGGNVLLPTQGPFSNSFFNLSPYASWQLQATTNTDVNFSSLCVASWTLEVSVRHPLADIDADDLGAGPGQVDEGSDIDIDMRCSADSVGYFSSFDYKCDINDLAYTNDEDGLATCSYPDDATVTVETLVTDGTGLTDTDTTVITVNNVAPTIDEWPGTVASTHVEYGEEGSECFSASDPGADPLTFDLVNEPEAMSLFNTSFEIGNPTFGGGCLSWTPQCADVDFSTTESGSSEIHTFSITVDDDDDGHFEETHSITVSDLDTLDNADCSLEETSNDGVTDCADNCPFECNPAQADHDGDGFDLDAAMGPTPPDQSTRGGDECDADSDNDDIPNGSDNCDPNQEGDVDPLFSGETDSEIGLLPSGGFHSNLNDDWDVDGCKDDDTIGPNEDTDDDNDGVGDSGDLCDPDANPNDITGQGQTNPGVFFSAKDWNSIVDEAGLATDYDGDGCQDYDGIFGEDIPGEDTDDDNDGVPDSVDLCDPDTSADDDGPVGAVLTVHTGSTIGVFNGIVPEGTFVDHDGDGCEDDLEDPDDDNDGRADAEDDCDPDDSEDDLSAVPPNAAPSSGNDASETNWDSNTLENDHDADGCKDEDGGDADADDEDNDDDNDGVADPTDKCDADDLPDDGHLHGALGYPDFETAGASDYDGDGCVDDDVDNDGNCSGTCPAEDGDDDNDGALDPDDDCDPDLGDASPDFNSELGWTSTQSGGTNNTGSDWDDDGCKDTDGTDVDLDDEDDDDDNDGLDDGEDDCDPSGNTGTPPGWDDPMVFTSQIGWDSSSSDPDHDYDDDGCKDFGPGGATDPGEDLDDDDDRQVDTADDCDPDDEARALLPACMEGSEDAIDSDTGWDSSLPGADHDDDGCQDDEEGSEDGDDDNDCASDESDDCDPDGYAGEGQHDPSVTINSAIGWDSTTGDYDGDGCQDSGEDRDDDDDYRLDGLDACNSTTAERGWTSINLLEAPAGCTYYLDEGSGRTYLRCVGPLNWDNARAFCQARNGDLANIDDATENGIIATLATGLASAPYVGGHDQFGGGGEGQWVWADTGENFWNGGTGGATVAGSYANWPGTEPNNLGDEDCLHVGSTGAWNDIGCGAALPFICEVVAPFDTEYEATPPIDGDYDDDGCADEDTNDDGDDEDEDDDGDGIADATDICDPDQGTDFDTDSDNDTGPVGAVLTETFPYGVDASDLGWTSSSPGTDHDGDGCQDATEDGDDDNDAAGDSADDCDVDVEGGLTLDEDAEGSLLSSTNWNSADDALDWDSDGCKDQDPDAEDGDDDSDEVADGVDDCDPDGFADQGQDNDPGAGVAPASSNEPYTESDVNWDGTPDTGGSPDTDHDNDGCQDAGEDSDDDDDLRADGEDDCDPDDEDRIVDDLFTMADENELASQVGFDTNDDLVDHDDDGCLDNHSEDNNDDNDRYLDGADVCPKGVVAWEGDDYDSDGCEDYDGGVVAADNLSEDIDLDNDGILNAGDRCDLLDGDTLSSGQAGWSDAMSSERDRDGFVSSTLTNDRDGDGCKDEDSGLPATEEDGDDDGDGKADDVDACDPDAAGAPNVVTDLGISLTSDTAWTSTVGGPLGSSTPGTDWDDDGCRDAGEDLDDDADGRADGGDRCDPDSAGPAEDTGILASEKNWSSSDDEEDADADGCRVGAEDTDGDNDGVPNGSDLVCTSSPAPCADLDGDGCCNVEESDDDNDGVLDGDDDCDPESGNGSSQTGDFDDHDGDGCRDDHAEDGDDDNDTVLDAADQCDPDSGDLVIAVGFVSDHGTGTPGNDYDNDGCRDSGEDLDDDGDLVDDVDDRCDPDAGGPTGDTGIFSSVKGAGGDYDGDGCKDANLDADPDDDNDGRPDASDACDPDPSGPAEDTGSVNSALGPELGSFDSLSSAQDNDDDGCEDATEDPDDDNDGVTDGEDNCPIVPNPGQEDDETPGGLGDACDGDTDGDGVDDGVDNCASVANPDQTNTDEDLDNNPDALGDDCDDDDDGDGVDDADDNCQLVPNGEDDTSNQADMDGDDVGDVCDDDRDGDGLLNDDECLDDPETGADECDGDPLAGLDPDNRDTDGDTIDDGTEVGDDTDEDDDELIDDEWLTDPRDSDSGAAEPDGVIDALDLDSDDDTLTDEAEAGDDDLDTPPVDTDGNGDPDYRDSDSDEDGTTDDEDNCVLIANDQADNIDMDEFGDACDDDADGDGLINSVEDALGTDPFDVDSDGDTIDDLTEVGPNPATAFNTDGNGPIDALDEDSDDDSVDDVDEAGDALLATPPVNTDQGGLPDYRDTDSDNDGIGDAGDNCRVVQNVTQTNSDAGFPNADALGDACDTDDDNDGVLDTADNCPVGPTQNASQTDSDGDATTPGPFPGNGGDVCDLDDDNDTVGDTIDNCPLVSNASQLNTDVLISNNPDGLGDACDGDDDGDGVEDAPDNCDLVPNADQTNSDTDADGNACDTDDDDDTVADGSDNCPVNANLDQADNDGTGGGDACDTDDDNDGDLDVADNCPFVSNPDQANADETADGGDACDADDDNDDVADDEDNCPTDANEDQDDTDDDGDGDACDSNDDGDAQSDRNDNCPLVPNNDQDDNDDDGDGDVCDDDDDNDDVDDDEDNCPLDANENQRDTDGDDDGDACDDDDDGDGIPDDDEEEDAGTEPQPDAGQAGEGGAGGSGGSGGSAGGGGAGSGAPDAGPGQLVACDVEAIVDAVGGELPDVLTRQTVLGAIRDAGVAVPPDAENPTADEVEAALEDEGVLIPDDCDLEALLNADAITKRKPDDGCGCATVGAPSEHGGTRAALLAGLALVLGYRRRRRAA